jgi:xanthine/uracil/vitamin C permease (AzgA family)
MLQRLFQLRERGTNVRIEALGGVTTFVTMAYIMVVKPAILATAGLPAGPRHRRHDPRGGLRFPAHGTASHTNWLFNSSLGESS